MLLDLIPELPLRLGSIDSSLEEGNLADRSCKVDFYVRSKCGQNIFLEFKSDSGSRKKRQDDYLSKCRSMKSVLAGIVSLHSATKPIYKKKYEHLINRLVAAGLIEKVSDDKYRPMSQNDIIRVIYMQPRRTSANKETIELGDIVEALKRESQAGEFVAAFCKSLKAWSND